MYRCAHHQPGQGRQNIDGGVDLAILQLPVHVDLALGDVACQVGDGVGDVVVGHGQDGQLGDAAGAALYAPGPLVDGGQIRVHVACRAPTGSQHMVHRPSEGGALQSGVACVGQHLRILLDTIPPVLLQKVGILHTLQGGRTSNLHLAGVDYLGSLDARAPPPWRQTPRAGHRRRSSCLSG